MIASRFQFPDNVGQSSDRTSDALDQALLLGRLILTDDGRTGRVRGFVPDPEKPFSALEVEGMDGGMSLLSPRDIRFVYSSGDHHVRR
jgi:hypothetical protein